MLKITTKESTDNLQIFKNKMFPNRTPNLKSKPVKKIEFLQKLRISRETNNYIIQ